MKNRRSLLLGGMHRSHTSLLAESLQRAGLFIGNDLIPAATSNARGHFESKAIVDFHLKWIKNKHLTSWWNFIDKEKAKEVALSDSFQKSANSLVTAFFKQELFGWKDPRSAFFLDGWHRILPDPHYIFCVRHPARSVQSLNKRSLKHTSIKFRPYLTKRHFNLWYNTNKCILDFVRKYPEQCFILHLPDDLERPDKIDQMNHCIQDRWGLHLKDVEFDSIYDQQLVTSTNYSAYVKFIYENSEKVKSLYKDLLKFS